MAVITVSGEPGCRTGEVARLVAQQLRLRACQRTRGSTRCSTRSSAPAARVSGSRPGPTMAASILLRLATDTTWWSGVDGAENLFRNFPGLLRVRVVAPRNRGASATLMLDDGLERAAARQQLGERESGRCASARKTRFGRATAAPEPFDMILNAEALDGEQHGRAASRRPSKSRGISEHGLLSNAAEAQLQFQIRLQLARHGIHPTGTRRACKPSAVLAIPARRSSPTCSTSTASPGNTSRTASPSQWDERRAGAGEPSLRTSTCRSSTCYVELTTMKQSLVTKKNRKIRLLREIYPQIKIQVFYQKDLQDLIFKYGLAEQKAVANS